MRMSEKNEAAVIRAGKVYDLYRKIGLPDDEDGTAIFDLVADLCHLAESLGVMRSQIPSYMDRALNHYEEESDPDNAEEEV